VIQLVQNIDIQIDLDQLKDEAQQLIARVGWQNSQIALQYTTQPDWVSDVDHYGYVRKEHECVNWHPDMAGSYIKQLVESIHPTPASARLMLLPPITCYITHVDLYTRFQVPIIGEPLKSFMVFNQLNHVVNMIPGQAYWVNTHEIHNYVNGAYTDRINLIFNDSAELPYLDNPHLYDLFTDFNGEVKWK
jgi:hypothetical protein